MALFDRVLDLQGRGMSSDQIVSLLQSEGVSSKDISDALNQAQVKSAIASPGGNPIPVPDPSVPDLQGANVDNSVVVDQSVGGGVPGVPDGMQASIQSIESTDPSAPSPSDMTMGSDVGVGGQTPLPVDAQPPGVGMPVTQELSQAGLYPSQDQAAPVGDEGFYQSVPNAYADQGYGADYYGVPPLNTETIAEVAQQVVSEKFSDFEKQTGDLLSFQNSVNDKLSDLDSRLRRVEDSLAQLQSAVIGKVGEFGQSAALIHKDLENLHGTVGKLMDPLVDNLQEMKKHKHHKT